MAGLPGRRPRPRLDGRLNGQFPVILRRRMYAVHRGVGINLARAFREGA